MRLFLLPISTRRTLIYCERAAPNLTTPGAKAPIADRIITKTSQTWTAWEGAEKGWQKKVTEYGNALFRRIPFEEWGLKTLPPATKQKLQDVEDGKMKFECLYPGKFLEGSKVGGVLERLGKERQGLHKRKMWSSVAWMPVSAPFTLVPVIPNLPFFYLCFRAYSHYRALFGGRMLEYLMSKNLIKQTASAQLDAMYTRGLLHPTRQASREAEIPSEGEIEGVSCEVAEKSKDGEEEVMVLQKWNGKLLAEAFELPEMEVEIERAVEQVEKSIKEAKEKGKQEGETAKEKDS